MTSISLFDDLLLRPAEPFSIVSDPVNLRFDRVPLVTASLNRL